MPGYPKDLTNQRFGRLLVIGKAANTKTPSGKTSVNWECLCDCGKTCIKRSVNLLSEDTHSCGCLHKETISERNKKMSRHKESQNCRLYKIWSGMKKRCNNPNAHEYHRYGGRGITYTDEWNDYVVFREWAIANGYTDNTHIQLDRIDNDGNYCPENCRWVTAKVQGNNRSTNKYITYNGVRRSLSEWADELNMSYDVLQNRFRLGWDTERAFTQPIRGINK